MYEFRIQNMVMQIAPEEFDDLMREDILFLSYEMARLIQDDVLLLSTIIL